MEYEDNIKIASPILDVRENLENKVKLSIAVIGIGNAGNQIVARAYREGYSVFAINSSLKDLNDTVVNEHIPSFIAGKEARGAGKNREYAKKIFNYNGKELFTNAEFSKIIETADIVFVVSSTAGGTGSGISPVVVSLLTQMYPSKIIKYYGILPKLSDSIQAQYNTLDCINEINDIKGVSYMLADLSYYEEDSNDVAYAGVADNIITSINTIAGKYLNASKNGMIDENDMRVIVGEPGYGAVYMIDKVTQEQVDKASIQKYMIDKIKRSPAADMNRDSIVKQMGVIVNCPEEMAEATKSGNYSELTDYIGTPLAIFENYSISNTTLGQFILILSGMNLPYARLLKCKEVIKEAEERIKRQKEINLANDVNEFDFIKKTSANSRLMSDAEDTADAKQNVLDTFFK